MELGQDFLDWFGNTYQGVDPSKLQTSDLMGYMDQYNSTTGGLTGGINDMLGTSMSGSDLLKGGMGLGRLGLGVLSYLDDRKLGKKKGKIMDQQIDQNDFLIKQAKGRQADISKTFGGNNGLAASTAKLV